MKTAEVDRARRPKNIRRVAGATAAVALAASGTLLAGCAADNKAVVSERVIPNFGQVVGPDAKRAGFTLIDTCVSAADAYTGLYRDSSFTVAEASGKMFVSQLDVVGAGKSTDVQINDIKQPSSEQQVPRLFQREAGTIASDFKRAAADGIKEIAVPSGALPTEAGGVKSVTCEVDIPSGATLTHGGPGEDKMSDLKKGAFLTMVPLNASLHSFTGDDHLNAYNNLYVGSYPDGSTPVALNPTPMTLE